MSVSALVEYDDRSNGNNNLDKEDDDDGND